MDKWNKNILLIFSACLLVFASCKPRTPVEVFVEPRATLTPTCVPCPSGSLEFEVLGYPAAGGEFVISSQEEYDEFLTDHMVLNFLDNSWAPVIDFEEQTLIGVSLGWLSSGGYYVEITGVETDCESIIVEVLSNSPCAGGFVTDAFTNPNHFVLIDKAELPVVFEYYTDRDCPDFP